MKRKTIKDISFFAPSDCVIIKAFKIINKKLNAREIKKLAQSMAVLVFALLAPTLCFASADGIFYGDTYVCTTLVPDAVHYESTPSDNPDEPGQSVVIIDSLKMDLPFRAFAETVKREGQDITTSYRANVSLVGKEVVAYVQYAKRDVGSEPRVENQEAVVLAYPGNMGKDPRKDARYARHWNVTKAEALATYDEAGNKTLYQGEDKDELTLFGN